MKSDRRNKLDKSFYLGGDVVSLAQKLIGKKLTTSINGTITSGIIAETEAYCGRNDKACHTNNGRHTPRSEVMYNTGGASYVCKCYGIHDLFNVVTNKEGLADAVLIRAIEPVEGIEIMKKRRGAHIKDKQLTSGPGKLTGALGIDTKHNGELLYENLIWIEEGVDIPLSQIETDVRVGVEGAGEDALKPWRFFIRNNGYISKKKQKT